MLTPAEKPRSPVHRIAVLEYRSPAAHDVLEEEKEALNNQINSLKGDISRLNEKISGLEKTIAEKDKEIAGLKKPKE